MKYVSKKEYDAVAFDGSFPSLQSLFETFPDATFRVDMDNGVPVVAIKNRPGKPDYSYIQPGNYVIFEGDQFTVYEPDAFIRFYGTSPSELAVQEGLAADQSYDPIMWGEQEERMGDDGTRWYEKPLFDPYYLDSDLSKHRRGPLLPTEEQF